MVTKEVYQKMQESKKDVDALIEKQKAAIIGRIDAAIVAAVALPVCVFVMRHEIVSEHELKKLLMQYETLGGGWTVMRWQESHGWVVTLSY